MKTKFLIILLSIFCLDVFGQNIHVQLQNSETLEPIPQVTIFTSDMGEMFTSNDNGEIVMPESLVGKTFYTEDYEYVPSKQTIQNISPIIWKLTPNSETLEEIVIYNRPLKEVLLEVIKHSEATMSKNMKLNTYYREDFIKDGSVYAFAEGLMDFYVGSKNKEIFNLVNQSRAVTIEQREEEFGGVIIDPNTLIKMVLKFHLLKDLINDKNYEYSVFSKKVGDRDLRICYIQPTEKAKKRFLRNGYFIFDEDKKLVLEYEFSFDESKKLHNKPINILIAKFDFKDMQVKAKYLDAAQAYYPTHSNVVYDIIINSKLAKVNKYRSHGQAFFYTIGFNKIANIPYDKESFNQKTLFSLGDNFTEEFWLNPTLQNYSKQ